MRLKSLYVLYDTKAKAIVGQIVAHHTWVPIVRQLTDEASNPESIIHKSPADFTLYHIGEIDEENCQLTFQHDNGDRMYLTITPVVRADELVTNQEANA